VAGLQEHAFTLGPWPTICSGQVSATYELILFFVALLLR
jgi:hypothetical protein